MLDSFSDHRAVPARAVLPVEGDQVAGGVDARSQPGGVQQEQRLQRVAAGRREPLASNIGSGGSRCGIVPRRSGRRRHARCSPRGTTRRACAGRRRPARRAPPRARRRARARRAPPSTPDARASGASLRRLRRAATRDSAPAQESHKRAQRERERALERNRRMAADEHHLQQIFVAIGRGGGRLEFVERVTRCDPRGAPNRIDHAAPSGDVQPGAGALGDVRTPALDRGDESLLNGGLDQIEATRSKRVRERRRDRGRVLSVKRVEIDHAQERSARPPTQMGARDANNPLSALWGITSISLGGHQRSGRSNEQEKPFCETGCGAWAPIP